MIFEHIKFERARVLKVYHGNHAFVLRTRIM
jgi:hypothetical protein